MQIKKAVVFMLLIAIVDCSHAQNIKYARKTVNKLCSKQFAGRGYINNGATNSGKFIAKEMKKTGLQPFAKEYLQPYSFPVNTIEKCRVQFLDENKKKIRLVEGRDYLVGSGSQTIQQKLILSGIPVVNNAVLSDSLSWKATTKHSGKWVFLDTLSSETINKQREKLNWLYTHCHVVEFSNAKLTWDVSTQTNPYCRITLIGRLRHFLASRELEVEIKSRLIKPTQYNILGFVPGNRRPDSFLVVCAHYDHLGKMGKAVFPGANDNAAGVAMMLDLAKYYNKNPHPYTVLFIAFSGEEAGLEGSFHFVKTQRYLLYKMRFVLNLDLVGTGETGMTVVNATVFDKDFALLDSLNKKGAYLPEIRKRGKAANSDHYAFTELGVPSFFCYLSGPRNAYHDIEDIPQTLSLKGYRSTWFLFENFLNSLP